jgi:hypothetical protein
MRRRFNGNKVAILAIAMAATASLCGIASAQITGVAEAPTTYKRRQGLR